MRSTQRLRSETTASRSERKVASYPSHWTHGWAEQRQSWFVRGVEGSGPQSCDTFKGRV